jgi:vancomycin resistance protein VanJ
MTRLRFIALLWVCAVLALLAIHVLLPQRSGPIALTEVFEPYIALTGLVAAVVAFRPQPRIARPLVLLLLIVLLARCGPASISNPSGGAGELVQVMAWNMEAGLDAGERVLTGVLKSEADLIGLEELQPHAAAALDADSNLTSRLPYRALEPEATVRGVGLLSRYPIIEHQVSLDPPYVRTVVVPSLGNPIAVFVVHPLPARFNSVAGIPLALDAQKRDADIMLIRSLVDQDLRAGRSVIVMGDINTTEREPAYADLSVGLRDAHLDAGIGPGLMWRPPSLAFLPFGLLRIDYVFASSPIVVTSTLVDCGVPSDHCRLEATLYLGPATQL